MGSGKWEVGSVIPLPDPRRSGRFAGLAGQHRTLTGMEALDASTNQLELFSF